MGKHQVSLPLRGNPQPGFHTVLPFIEVGDYEAIWAKEKVSFNTLSERFAAVPSGVPFTVKDAVRYTQSEAGRQGPIRATRNAAGRNLN